MIAYIEYGIDFDNNRFGLGKSIEIEESSGKEYRTKKNIRVYNKRHYVRLWVGKKVFSYSVNDGFKIKNKNRNNFKLIFGVAGSVPSINLMCGFMGFGKTTIAKNLSNKISAVVFTHDEIMLQKYGRTPDNFEEKYKETDSYIKEQTIKNIKSGKSVILDYGFWSKKDRKEYYDWAKNITPNVVFHVVDCNINLAKHRVLNRSETDKGALFIDEACFLDRLKRFEPYDEEYSDVVYYKT